MTSDNEGFGENNDEYYDDIRRRKYLAERAETEAKEEPFYQSQNILGSLGRKSDKDGIIKRTIKKKGLIIEDMSASQGLAEICQMAHDSLVKVPGGEPEKKVVYDLKVYWGENTLRKKVLKYLASFGTLNELLVFDKGPWQDVLAEVHEDKRVCYHPAPAGIMYVCG